MENEIDLRAEMGNSLESSFTLRMFSSMTHKIEKLDYHYLILPGDFHKG
jgi:hypothetical protein